ncbi:hypothetical protein ABW20_dc0106407 [Dactylellina cionopaga]|nr:hypothetical protein ABW20_dc0106407 [Dactylellina cionopaga]
MLIGQCVFMFLAASAVNAQIQLPWAQCGGLGHSGTTQCMSGSNCLTANSQYALCVPQTATRTEDTPISTAKAASTFTTITRPTASTSPADKRSTPNIVLCLASKLVPQALPGLLQFNFEIKPYNLRLPFTPVAVAMPLSVAHVQAAVLCGVQSNLKITAKAGGHSYASHGIGGEDGHLIINLKYLNLILVNPITNVATIGPGARLGNIAVALYLLGGRAISHGTCPGVGVGGHALHGGYGFSSHTRGLALDWLVEAQVVLVDGSVVTASATQNTDLFWAIKGAGGSFGIVVSMKFNTFPAPSSNVVFNYSYDWNQAQARSALETLQAYVNSTDFPRELNLRLLIFFNVTQIEGVYYGSQAAFASAINPLLSKLGPSIANSVSTVGWLESLDTYSFGSLITWIDYDVHDTFFAKSLMTTQLSPAAMDAFVTYWYSVARSSIANTRSWYAMIDLHGGPTSYISSITGDAGGSYAHRKKTFKFQFSDSNFGQAYPPDGFSFLNDWVNTITSISPQSTWGMYINYADPTLAPSDYASFYWRDSYPRLQSIKTRYDPNDIFYNPQVVRPL